MTSVNDIIYKEVNDRLLLETISSRQLLLSQCGDKSGIRNKNRSSSGVT